MFGRTWLSLLLFNLAAVGMAYGAWFVTKALGGIESETAIAVGTGLFIWAVIIQNFGFAYFIRHPDNPSRVDWWRSFLLAIAFGISFFGLLISTIWLDMNGKRALMMMFSFSMIGFFNAIAALWPYARGWA